MLTDKGIILHLGECLQINFKKLCNFNNKISDSNNSGDVNNGKIYGI